jgi:hypothetical protein
MNKLSIINNYDQYDIVIDKFKIFLGPNIKTKIKIIQTIRSYFQTSKVSDYSAANHTRRLLNWNDQYLDKRRFSLYELNQYYTLDKDLKLGSQSLLLKYYESALENIEYLDEVNTINTLLDCLNNEFITEHGQFDGISNLKLASSLESISVKLLVKIMGLSLLKEEFNAYEFDLDYDELIILQLNLLKRIALRQRDKDLIIIMDIPILTERITENLKFDSTNIAILIFPFYIEVTQHIDYKDIVLCHNAFTDLCNDEQLYDLSLDLPVNLSIEELRNRIFNKICNFISDKTDFSTYLE